MASGRGTALLSILVKKGGDLDDSWGRFWDRLITDWVIVVVGAFVVQGVWFALVSALARYKPELEATLATTSTRLALPWGLATLVALTWGVKRALEARTASSQRR